jgi:hemolysin III
MSKQTLLEEQLNTITHAIGAFLGAIGLVFLLVKNSHKTIYSDVSILIYGLSVVVLFSASALYHWVEKADLKHKFRILDHISIYLLIAGTYTPVLLINLLESKGVLLLIVVWTIALLGLLMKLFFTGRFEIFSTLLYLLMGWLIVLDFNNLKAVTDYAGILWLFAGGFFYTVGILFYVIEKIPFNHVIWHLFVLAGVASHYIMILNYVI